MNKLLAFLMPFFVAALVVATPARASVITFEDLYVAPDYFDPTLTGFGVQPVPNGYAGFQWGTQSAVINKYAYPGYAYYWGALDTMSLYTSYGANIWFTGGTFDFNGAYLTAHADAPYDLIVEGSRNGSLVYSKTVTITPWASPSTGLPYFYTFNFRGVDSVSFVTGGYRWVVIDNITINETFGAETTPLATLARAVDDLVVLGKVKRGIGNSLTMKLASASAALNLGDRQTALNNLDAFVSEIETHMQTNAQTGGRSDGSFPPIEGAALIQAAQGIAASI